MSVFLERPRAATHVSVYDSIREIDRQAWDGVVGDDPLASHGWLATVEATCLAELRRRYVVVRDGALLVGAAACSVSGRETVIETLDDRLLGRTRGFARAIGLSFSPALVCGPLRGGGVLPRVLRGMDPQRRGWILDRLLDTMENEADRCGLPPCFVDVPSQAKDLAKRLHARGYFRAIDTPLNVLDVPWPCFDDYLRHLDGITAGARKDIRRQMNQNGKRGSVIVALDDPEPQETRLHELMEGNERAYNRRPFGFKRGFFTTLKQNLGSDAVVYAAWKHGRVSAVSLLLRRGGTGHLPMVGVDHSTGNDFTYFNIAHYRPINDAISNGIRRLRFGRALYDLKARRGCRLEDVAVFYRPASRLGASGTRAWFTTLSSWNRVKLPRRARRSSLVATEASLWLRDRSQDDLP